MTTVAPIALFVYNRPQHTQQTVEALLQNTEAEVSDLYIFSDAAKNEVSQKSVNEVRNYIKKITGFNKIVIVERETNWGLANSIIDGVTRLCDDFGCVIVLEDDLVVSPHFLAYMNEGLKRYSSDEKVMQIAGYMFPASLDVDEEALFLPFISSWGWATWSRAWKVFDADAKGYSQLKKSSKMRKKFDLNGNYNYFKMLKSQQDGKTNSWAIRWYLSVFLSNGLALYPRKTMVQNSGFDGTGENCVVSTIHESKIDVEFEVLAYPENISVSSALGDVLANMPKPRLKFSSVIQSVKRLVAPHV